jgi:ABC-type branched-subunit amino acid transport system substrate-binding protein
MKKVIIGTVIIILLAIGLSRGTRHGSSPVPKDMFSIGMILPQTGFVANWGENQQKGIALALEQLGHPKNLNVIIEDSSSDPKKAVSAAEKLISINHVQILYTPFTGPTVAIAPIANRVGVLQLYEAAVTKPVEEFPDSSLKIGYYEHKRDCGMLGEYILGKQYKRVALLVAQTDQAIECVTTIKNTAAPGVEFHEEKYEINKEDFRTIIAKTKAVSYDAVLATGYESDFTKLYKAMAEQNLNKPFLCVAREDCLLDKHALEAPEGTVSFGGTTDPNFMALFKAKYPGASDFDAFSAATAYTAVLFAHEAAQNCPNLDLACLKNSVVTSRIKPALVSNGFLDNKLQLNPALVKLENGSVITLKE